MFSINSRIANQTPNLYSTLSVEQRQQLRMQELHQFNARRTRSQQIANESENENSDEE